MVSKQLTMEVQLQSSPKSKEPAVEERLVQLEDLRTLEKEERQSWKEELKYQFQGWSARVNISLENFEGELTQVAGRIQRWKNCDVIASQKRPG